MRFRAKGKGPLELPRLTNLGPMSEASEEIGPIVFRGRDIRGFNENEFRDNRIDGRELVLWVLDTEEAVHRYDIDTSGLIKEQAPQIKITEKVKEALIDNFRIGEEELNKFNVDTGDDEVRISTLQQHGLIEKEVRRPVTGGITGKVGTSHRFAKPGIDFEDLQSLPAVLFLERNRIEANLVDVEYTAQFIQESPLMAGQADKGSRMFSIKEFNGDGFVDFYAVGKDRDRGFYDVIQWFRNPLDNFRQLEPEDEIMTYTNSINLDESLFAVAIYFTEKRLSEFSSNFIRDVKTLKQEARELYPLIQRNMDKNEERLVLVLQNRVLSTGDKKVKRSKFEWIYDGEQFIEDYNSAIPFTNPTRF